jgi:large subunit ribosomal protein L3
MSTQKSYHEGLLGKKLGMTHIFSPEGEIVPVTILQTGPCYVLGVKKAQADGYAAVQFGFEPKKSQRVSKAEMGHFGKAGKGAFYHVSEMRCDAESLGWTTLGQEIRVGDVFKDGEVVDVSGTSIGRGFSGVVRKYHMKGSPATRGTHETRRHGGAIGQRKFPGHVFKNMRMCGHLGAAEVTVQNLTVVGVNNESNLLLVKGAVPGSRGSLVVVRKAARGQRKPVVDKGASDKKAA